MNSFNFNIFLFYIHTKRTMNDDEISRQQMMRRREEHLVKSPNRNVEINNHHHVLCVLFLSFSILFGNMSWVVVRLKKETSRNGEEIKNKIIVWWRNMMMEWIQETILVSRLSGKISFRFDRILDDNLKHWDINFG